MLFDTHAHYDDEAFDADRDALLTALPDCGVGLVIDPGCDLTSSRDGSIIEAAELYDASDEKGTLKGSILATLQKKLVVNTTGVLFDLLGKCGDRTAITAAGDYLSTALYTLLRHYYRRGGGNEDFFAVDSVDFDAGTVDAAMLRSRAVYLRALAEAEQVPELNSDALTAAPGVGQSTAQVVHNVDDLAAKR